MYAYAYAYVYICMYAYICMWARMGRVFLEIYGPNFEILAY
jgi:hypothetical protein